MRASLDSSAITPLQQSRGRASDCASQRGTAVADPQPPDIPGRPRLAGAGHDGDLSPSSGGYLPLPAQRVFVGDEVPLDALSLTAITTRPVGCGSSSCRPASPRGSSSTTSRSRPAGHRPMNVTERSGRDSRQPRCPRTRPGMAHPRGLPRVRPSRPWAAGAARCCCRVPGPGR